MKKFTMLALVLVLTLSMAACRRKDDNNETTTRETSTEATQGTTMMPEIEPTLETNIPDPEVDTSMPDMTDMIDGTEDASGNSGLAK